MMMCSYSDICGFYNKDKCPSYACFEEKSNAILNWNGCHDCPIKELKRQFVRSFQAERPGGFKNKQVCSIEQALSMFNYDGASNRY